MQLVPESLQKFYEIVISVSGILFPIFQAVLFFITEKSLNRFEFSRQELINLLQKKGVIISVSLMYIIIQSLLQILNLTIVANILLYFYLGLLLLFRIRLMHSMGVWNTMMTTKFIPAGSGKAKKFIVGCWNNTLLEKLKFICFITLLIIIPLGSKDAIFISVFMALTYSLLNITLLLHEPVLIQKELLKTENTLDEFDKDECLWQEEKIEQEMNDISKQMQNNYLFQKNIKDVSGMFEIGAYPKIGKNGELWNNVFLKEVTIRDRDIFKNRILEISMEYFIEVYACKTDINSFVLSFHFDLEGYRRNLFIRMSRKEIEDRSHLPLDAFFNGLKSVLIDEILK